ncbi:MAG: alpha-L-fucosidase [Limisphaerales bacterium]
MKGWIAVLLILFAGVFCNAAPNNPNTDWFHDAGWGVFVHYLDGLQNNSEQLHSFGRQTAWNECVKEFDAKRFADQIAQTGAGYVIFTMQQRTRFFIAPNATFDRLTGYKPGEACATRDLVLDLSRALRHRGVRLMLYWTGDGPRDDERASKGLGGYSEPVSEIYVRNWAAVAREYGERYGDKVAGWWTDGCYPWIGYDEKKLGILAEGLKAGNPKRIVALNVGVQERVRAYSAHEDFTTGEQNTFADVPESRWVNGEQWHILSFLGCSHQGWATPGSKYKKQELADYVHKVNERGGVVSIDVMLYRDGTLDRSQLEMLKAIGRRRAR